jgi:hypothetical protein
VVGVAAARGGYGVQFRAVAAIAVWWAVLAGLAFGFWPRARVPRAALVAGAGLVGLAALAVLSTSWAPDNGTAFGEVVTPALYAGIFVLVVIAAPAGSAGSWLAGLGLGLVGVALLAVGSRVEPSLFPEQDLVRFLPSVATRLSYPLNYWNGLGASMALGLVVLGWLGAHAGSRGGRALAVAAIPLPALALFLTSSRGGVAALAVGLVVLIALSPARARLLTGALLGAGAAFVTILMANGRDAFVDGRVDAAGAASQGRAVLGAALLLGACAGALRLVADRPLERLRVPRAVTLVCVAILAVAGIGGLAGADLGERVDSFKEAPASPGPSRGFVTRHLASAEGNGRYQFWETGLDAFESEPLHGVGAGGYAGWWAEHGSLRYYIRDAHSLFVEVAAELGLLGLAALLCFLVAAAVRGVALRVRDPRAGPAAAGALALLACGSASAAIDWTWELPAAFAGTVVAAGLLAGPAVGGPAPGGAGGGRPRFGLGVATIGVAWLAIVAAGLVAVGDAKLGDSRASVRDGDLERAAEDAQAARAVQPWSGAPYLQLALVRERAGDLPGAREAARDAAERDPRDSQVWVVVARLAVKAGEVEEARAALRRARRLNPRSLLFASPSSTGGG